MNTVMERRLAAATSVKTAKRRAALRMPPQEYCGRHLPLSEHRHSSPNTTPGVPSFLSISSGGVR
jgi:hypothetical protein